MFVDLEISDDQTEYIFIVRAVDQIPILLHEAIQAVSALENYSGTGNEQFDA